MKTRLLLSVGFIFFCIISCQKDQLGNTTISLAQTEDAQIMQKMHTDTSWNQYFFGESKPELNLLESRDDDQNLESIKIEIAKQDAKSHFIEAQLDNYGTPFWLLNEKYKGNSDDENLYFIPFLKNKGKRIESIIAISKSKSAYYIDIVDRAEMEFYFQKKDGFKLRPNLDCFLMNYIAIEEKMFGKTSDEYKSWLLNWIKSHQVTGLETRDISCNYRVCKDIGNAYNTLESRTIVCSTFSYSCGGSSGGGGTTGAGGGSTGGGTVAPPTTTTSALGTHNSLLSTNASYAELNALFRDANPIVWAILKDVAIDILLNVFKKQFSNLSAAGIDAIQGIAQGDFV